MASLIQKCVDVFNRESVSSTRVHDASELVPSQLPQELLSPGLLSLDFPALLASPMSVTMAGPDARAPVFLSCLSAAALAGHLALVRQMMQGPYGCAANESSRSGITPLTAACWGGHAEVVAALLDAGGGVAGRRCAPDVSDIVNEKGPSAVPGGVLVPAIATGPRARATAASVVRVLVARGLTVSGGAVTLCLRSGCATAAAELCGAGAPWAEENTPLLQTIEGDDEDTVRALAELEAYASHAARRGVTRDTGTPRGLPLARAAHPRRPR